MKKLIALLLAITLLSGMMITNAYAGEEAATEEDTYYTDTVIALGIMSEFEEYLGTDAVVTRGEFAAILASILGDSDVAESGVSWDDKYLGEAKEEQPIIYEDSAKYIDVLAENPNSTAINLVTDWGLMSGTSDKTFAPDEPITYQDCVKTLVRLAGYDVTAKHSGGYPTGYMEVARKLKITSGLSLAQTDFITFDDMARLIYNTINVDVLKVVAYGTNEEYKSVEGETVLSEIMGIYKVEGVMTENDITSLKTVNNTAPGYTLIDGVELTFDENARHLRNYIGREVTAYYKMPKRSTKKTVIHLTPSDEGDVITIDADDIIGSGNGYFSYEDSNSRVKKVTVDRNTSIIYNGIAQKSYDWDILRPESGTVTVIENSEGKVIVINEYISFVVSSIDSENMVIYNKASDSSSVTDDVRLELSDDFRCSVRDKDGKALTFGDIKIGSVLSVAKSSKGADIILSDASVTGEVLAITDGDKIEIEGTEYTLSPSFAKAAQAPKVEVGSSGNFFFDAFGKLAWFESSAEWQCSKAHLIKVGTAVSGFENPSVKLFNFGDNQIAIKKLAGNVVLIDEYGSRDKKSATEVRAYLEGDYPKGLIGFLVNADDEITRIELPLDPSVKATGIYKIFETNDDPNSLYYYKMYEHMTIGNFIGAKVHLNANSKILIVPRDEADDDEYKVVSYSSLNNGLEFIFSAYSMHPDSPHADYLIAYAPDNSTIIDQYTYPLVVTKVAMSTNENDEFVKVIEGIKDGTAVKYYAPFDKKNSKGEECTAIDIASDPLKSKDESGNLIEHAVEPGDIIRCAMSGEKDTLEKVEILFDYSAKNPYWKNSTVSGSIAGAKGDFVFESPFKGYMENPIAIFDDAPQNIGRRVNLGEYRCIYGYVYSKHDGYIRITTQDIVNEEFDPANLNFVEEYHRIGDFTSTMVTMKVGGRNITASKGSAADVKAFLDVGSDCSRVFIVTGYGVPRRMIVINE